MSFFAILLAFLLEQARPLSRDNFVHANLRVWVSWVTRNFDTGRPHHAWLVWSGAVVLPALIASGIHWVVMVYLGWLFAVIWSVAILYLTLGFRQFSSHFTQIRIALVAGDEEESRRLLAIWQQIDANDIPRREIIRHVIEFSILSAHRHVFGVLVCFSVFAAIGMGPAGAIVYRLSDYVARYWKNSSPINGHVVSEASQNLAKTLWRIIDWLPARLTALGFAVVGSFEEAIDRWRNFQSRGLEDNDGLILAATSGAVGINLGEPVLESKSSEGDTPAISQEPQISHLTTIVGLVWRSVVMWMVLLALLTFARLLG